MTQLIYSDWGPWGRWSLMQWSQGNSTTYWKLNDNTDKMFESKDDDDNYYISSNSSIGPIDAFLNNIIEKSQHNSSVIFKTYLYQYKSYKF